MYTINLMKDYIYMYIENYKQKYNMYKFLKCNVSLQ